MITPVPVFFSETSTTNASTPTPISAIPPIATEILTVNHIQSSSPTPSTSSGSGLPSLKFIEDESLFDLDALTCHACNKSFKNTRAFKLHRDRHQGALKHKCPECIKTFNGRSEVNRHMVAIHGRPLKNDEDTLHKKSDTMQAQQKHNKHVSPIQKVILPQTTIEMPMVTTDTATIFASPLETVPSSVMSTSQFDSLTSTISMSSSGIILTSAPSMPMVSSSMPVASSMPMVSAMPITSPLPVIDRKPVICTSTPTILDMPSLTSLEPEPQLHSSPKEPVVFAESISEQKIVRPEISNEIEVCIKQGFLKYGLK